MRRIAIALILFGLAAPVSGTQWMQSILEAAARDAEPTTGTARQTMNFAETGTSRWFGQLLFGGRSTPFVLEMHQSSANAYRGLMMIHDADTPRGYRMQSVQMSRRGASLTMSSTDIATSQTLQITGTLNLSTWQVRTTYQRADGTIGVMSLTRLE